MIRPCLLNEFTLIYEIINDAALAYKGIIPNDCWHFPYMTKEEIVFAIEEGVKFYGYEDNDNLIGIMGIQEKKDVTLIRHAYVRTINRKSGIGSKLLNYLKGIAKNEILIGTWAAADWAINFYKKHGFILVSDADKDRLLKKYWEVSQRQIETSVVLKESKS